MTVAAPRLSKVIRPVGSIVVWLYSLSMSDMRTFPEGQISNFWLPCVLVILRLSLGMRLLILRSFRSRRWSPHGTQNGYRGKTIGYYRFTEESGAPRGPMVPSAGPTSSIVSHNYNKLASSEYPCLR